MDLPKNEIRFLPFRPKHIPDILPTLILFQTLDISVHNPAEETYPEVARTVPFSDMPPLYSSFLVRKGMLSSPLMLLRDWLAIRLKEDFAHNEKGVKTS